MYNCPYCILHDCILTVCKALIFSPAMVWGTTNINELRAVEELKGQNKEATELLE